ncbi:guanine nucleotide-binding protein subunit gamma-1 [Clonorchis sinensis]|uniref:Guanine nucleotide-binding protein subunit gamma-1 n=2 Tax=Opisthorchiidae TaxID=6196 RepID=G7YJE2_CLOSI|nr:guanine nucleotide-binding protein subunit gamma-1 [Clonorchis sinensis]
MRIFTHRHTSVGRDGLCGKPHCRTFLALEEIEERTDNPRTRTPIFTRTMSTLTQQRKLVEQLRQEANLNRRPVSECVRDMIAYMEQNRDKDCLVSGFASKKDNPFQEKGGCLML